MNTIEIPEKSLIVEIPSHWDEMTEREVFYCLSQILRGDSPLSGERGFDSVLHIQIKCFYHLAGIRRSWRSIFLEKIMPAEWILEKNTNAVTLAQQLTAFMFTGERADGRRAEGVCLNYDTILNHFPVVSIRGKFPTQNLRLKTLIGPSDLLADLTFGEFRAAIEEMNDYFDSVREEAPSSSGEGGALSRFIATLYRPERKNYHELSQSETFDGQRREPFNRNRIDMNARLCDRMHPVHRTAILLWFTYCINYIQTEDLIISGRTINLKTLFPKPKDSPLKKGEMVEDRRGKGSGSGWTSLLYAIAKEGIFGNAEATDKTGLFDVLLYMYDQHMENKKLKAKYSKKTKS